MLTGPKRPFPPQMLTRVGNVFGRTAHKLKAGASRGHLEFYFIGNKEEVIRVY